MITVQFEGRLGNQMFQYAVCRVIAEKKGLDYYIPDTKYLGQNIQDFFLLETYNNKNGTNKNPISYKYVEGEEKYDIFEISDGTKLIGYFQSEKYFKGFEDKIKSWYKIKMDDKTQELLDKYPVNEYCYIHFRGTDYVVQDNWFLPISYYKEAMKIIEREYNKKKFVVITDDIENAKKYFDCDIISNNMMIDFKLLYYSKYSIITNSTFSWWTTWLSDKVITIGPDCWLNYNKKYLGFKPPGIYMINKIRYI